MLKKLCLAVGAVIVGLAVINFTSLGSLAKVKFTEMTNWADRQVPPETKLKQVRVEMSKIDKDIRHHVDKLAVLAEEVDSDRTKVAALKKEQVQRKEEIAAMTKALESTSEKVVYNGSAYNQAAMVKKLDQAVTNYERLKSEVKAKEQVLAQKSDLLDTSKQRIKAMQQQKEELQVAVEELESRIEALKTKKVDRSIEVDDSQVNKCNVLLESVRKRVAQDEKTLELYDELGIKTKMQDGKEVRDTEKSKAEVVERAHKAGLDNDDVTAEK
jgi:chromosome segregation ATPase